MSRSRRRAGSQAFVLYQAGEEMRPIERCSLRRGEGLVEQGKAVHVVDAQGQHVGFQLRTRDPLNGTPAVPVATVFSPAEMELVAGQTFKFGRSRTASLSEAERLTRKTLTGRPLPAEDKVERAAAKLKYWAPRQHAETR